MCVLEDCYYKCPTSPAMSSGAKKEESIRQRLIPFRVSTVGTELVDNGTEHARAARNFQGIHRMSPTIHVTQKGQYLGVLDRHVPVMMRTIPTREPTTPMARPVAQNRVSVVSGSRVGTWGSQCLRSGSSRPQCSTRQS